HGISAFFKRDFVGNWLDLGDLAIEGITFAPEFTEFQSVRNGPRGVRKRVLASRSGQISLRLNEPRISNLALVAYGSTPATPGGSGPNILEGRTAVVKDDGSGNPAIDFTELEPDIEDYSEIENVRIYLVADDLLANLVLAD